MPVINYERTAQIIREVAADKIVPRFRQLREGDIRSKSGPTDLVTIADEEAEVELTRTLTKELAGSLAIGEEAVSNGKILREVLQTSDEYIWVIDPVDGTNNFAHGKPIFGTIVALVKNGETIASWIYQIPVDRMVFAVRGGGVCINDVAIKKPVVPPADVDFKTLKAFVSRRFVPPEIRPYVDDKVKSLADASTYLCCAWEYVDLAEGVRSFSVYKRIEPWDHLAGVLIAQEQGYFVRKWNRSEYSARDLDGGLISAPSPELWERIWADFVDGPLRAAKAVDQGG